MISLAEYLVYNARPGGRELLFCDLAQCDGHGLLIIDAAMDLDQTAAVLRPIDTLEILLPIDYVIVKARLLVLLL